MNYKNFSRHFILCLLAAAGTLTHAAEAESSETAKPLPPMPPDEISDDDPAEALDNGPAPNTRAVSPSSSSIASSPAVLTGHQDCALALLRLLSDTEVCLNGCRDADSVQAAIPRLRMLKQQAQQIADTQRHLPEPTSQDLLSMNQHMQRFNVLWEAIKEHILRLEEAGLINQELRDILYIAQPTD